MKRELEMFEYKKKLASAVGDIKAASVISRAVYVICAGSNDVVQYFQSTSTENLNQAQYSERLKEMATQYVKVIIILYVHKFVYII
jgi:hypothetical protein